MGRYVVYGFKKKKGWVNVNGKFGGRCINSLSIFSTLMVFEIFIVKYWGKENKAMVIDIYVILL